MTNARVATLMTRRASFILILAGALCQCEKKKPPPERTEPWRAVPSSVPSADLPERAVNYVILPESRVWFELSGREHKPKGEISGISGTVQINFADAQQTRATLKADLKTLRMLNERGVADETYTTQALNWLSLGARVPGAARTRSSTATFTLTRVDAKSSLLASLMLQSDDLRAGATRRAQFAIKGNLLLHGYRVPMLSAALLEFELPTPPDVTPDRLSIRSHKPLVVSLQVHDIKPRNEAGTLLSQELKSSSSRVGRAARVHFELQARRAMGDDSPKKP